MDLIRRLARQREFMIAVVVAVVFVAMCFASPYFLSSGNLLALLLGLSVEAIIAVAMTNLMVSGGFDMSVGSVVAFTGAATALLLTSRRAGLRWRCWPAWSWARPSASSTGSSSPRSASTRS